MNMQISANGRLGRAPKRIETRTGTVMAVSSLAVELQVGQSDETTTQWLNLVTFGKTAEQLLQHDQGDLVRVLGNVQIGRWDRNGEPVDQLSVVAQALLSARTVRPGGKKAQQTKPAAVEEFDDEVPF